MLADKGEEEQQQRKQPAQDKIPASFSPSNNVNFEEDVHDDNSIKAFGPTARNRELTISDTESSDDDVDPHKMPDSPTYKVSVL